MQPLFGGAGRGNSDCQELFLADRGESLQPGKVKQAGSRMPCTGLRVPRACCAGEAGMAIPVMLLVVKLEG